MHTKIIKSFYCQNIVKKIKFETLIPRAKFIHDEAKILLSKGKNLNFKDNYIFYTREKIAYNLDEQKKLKKLMLGVEKLKLNNKKELFLLERDLFTDPWTLNSIEDQLKVKTSLNLGLKVDNELISYVLCLDLFPED